MTETIFLTALFAGLLGNVVGYACGIISMACKVKPDSWLQHAQVALVIVTLVLSIPLIHRAISVLLEKS